MGYESKIYVCDKSDYKDNDGMFFSMLIAMFDMSCCPALSNVFQKETDCYIYADDGNTKILKDCYGDRLREAEIGDAIHAVEVAISKGNNYRRFPMLLAALKSLHKQMEDGMWNNLVLLHYGY